MGRRGTPDSTSHSSPLAGLAGSQDHRDGPKVQGMQELGMFLALTEGGIAIVLEQEFRQRSQTPPLQPVHPGRGDPQYRAIIDNNITPVLNAKSLAPMQTRSGPIGACLFRGTWARMPFCDLRSRAR